MALDERLRRLQPVTRVHAGSQDDRAVAVDALRLVGCEDVDLESLGLEDPADDRADLGGRAVLRRGGDEDLHDDPPSGSLRTRRDQGPATDGRVGHQGRHHTGSGAMGQLAEGDAALACEEPRQRDGQDRGEQRQDQGTISSDDRSSEDVNDHRFDRQASQAGPTEPSAVRRPAGCRSAQPGGRPAGRLARPVGGGQPRAGGRPGSRDGRSRSGPGRAPGGSARTARRRPTR